MSLDVDLIGPEHPVECRDAIFIRDGGQTREVTREEWDKLHPGREPVTVKTGGSDRSLFSMNITHNLGKMAAEADIYEALWRPDEAGFSKAKDLIEPLRAGLTKLKENPAAFEAFNPSNGWGDYDGLVAFVEAYLNACIEYPHADVEVSR